jgi:hypothetical protein
MAGLRSIGGHPRHIFVDIDKQFDCGLCLDILNDPFQCKNGHMFCKSCILHSINKVGRKCPTCKTYLTTETISRNLLANNQIHDAKVKCACFDEQCDWIGTISTRSNRDCPYLYAQCQNENCGEVLLRTEMASHLTMKCAKRFKQCSYCHIGFQFDVLTTHKRACLHKPMRCECGSKLPVHEIPLHRGGECSAVIVNCPVFDNYHVCVPTCIGTVRRGDIETHLGASSELILFMLSEKLTNA